VRTRIAEEVGQVPAIADWLSAASVSVGFLWYYL